jgi:hypothetical protein
MVVLHLQDQQQRDTQQVVAVAQQRVAVELQTNQAEQALLE